MDVPGSPGIRPRLARVVLGIGAVLWAVSWALPLRGQGTGRDTIYGKVTGPDGRPVEIEVRLQEVTRTVVNSAYSDSNGEFAFQGVADGVYYVTVESDLYQPAEVQTHVEFSVSPQVHILVPLISRSPRTSQPQQGFGNSPHVVSLQELLAKFPKKAVKAYEKGNKQLQNGDREGAIRSYQRALALAPGMYPALNNLGNAHLQGREMGQAEAAFRQALALDPGDPEPYINLGHLFFETRRYPEAEDHLRKGLNLNPNSPLGLFFLGATCIRLGNWSAAEANLQKALAQNDPAVAVAHLELATLYLKTRRRENARRELEAFLKEQPQAPQAEQVRQMLVRLGNPPQQPK